MAISESTSQVGKRLVNTIYGIDMIDRRGVIDNQQLCIIMGYIIRLTFQDTMYYFDFFLIVVIVAQSHHITPYDITSYHIMFVTIII